MKESKREIYEAIRKRAYLTLVGGNVSELSTDVTGRMWDYSSRIATTLTEAVPEKKEVYTPTDEQVGNGAYYQLREIKGHNAFHDKLLSNLREKK